MVIVLLLFAVDTMGWQCEQCAVMVKHDALEGEQRDTSFINSWIRILDL